MVHPFVQRGLPVADEDADVERPVLLNWSGRSPFSTCCPPTRRVGRSPVGVLARGIPE